LATMPDLNPTTGTHGLHSVSEGRVWPDQWGKPWCYRHGAMNAVNPERSIWRCLQFCGEAAYVTWVAV